MLDINLGVIAEDVRKLVILVRVRASPVCLRRQKVLLNIVRAGVAEADWIVTLQLGLRELA